MNSWDPNKPHTKFELLFAVLNTINASLVVQLNKPK
jgi:hypothetical protein